MIYHIVDTFFHSQRSLDEIIVGIVVDDELHIEQEETKSSWQEQYYLGLQLGLLILLSSIFIAMVIFLIHRMLQKKNRNRSK